MTRLEDLPPQWRKQVEHKLSGKKLAPARPRAQHEPMRMNKLEKRFEDEVLRPSVATGGILSYKFEPIKLRMAKRTWYTPDFLAIRSDMVIVIYEVKGYWEDDARVKWKTCAELFPEFVFVAARHSKGIWTYEYYHKEQEE